MKPANMMSLLSILPPYPPFFISFGPSSPLFRGLLVTFNNTYSMELTKNWSSLGHYYSSSLLPAVLLLTFNSWITAADPGDNGADFSLNERSCWAFSILHPVLLPTINNSCPPLSHSTIKVALPSLDRVPYQLDFRVGYNSFHPGSGVSTPSTKHQINHLMLWRIIVPASVSMELANNIGVGGSSLSSIRYYYWRLTIAGDWIFVPAPWDRPRIGVLWVSIILPLFALHSY